MDEPANGTLVYQSPEHAHVPGTMQSQKMSRSQASVVSPRSETYTHVIEFRDIFRLLQLYIQPLQTAKYTCGPYSCRYEVNRASGFTDPVSNLRAHSADMFLVNPIYQHSMTGGAISMPRVPSVRTRRLQDSFVGRESPNAKLECADFENREIGADGSDGCEKIMNDVHGLVTRCKLKPVRSSGTNSGASSSNNAAGNSNNNARTIQSSVQAGNLVVSELPRQILRLHIIIDDPTTMSSHHVLAFKAIIVGARNSYCVDECISVTQSGWGKNGKNYVDLCCSDQASDCLINGTLRLVVIVRHDWCDTSEPEVVPSSFVKLLLRPGSKSSEHHGNSMVYVEGEDMDGPSSTKRPALIATSSEMSRTDFLQDIWERELHWNVEIKTKDSTLKAHRSILAARSRYFNNLLNGDNCNVVNNSIEMRDVESNEMREVLRYIYTSKVILEGANINSVLRLANRFMLDGLKSKCAEVLMHVVNQENILEILQQAIDYGLHNLKYHCFKILKDDKDSLASPEFLTFHKKNPGVVAEFIHQFAGQ